MAEVVTLRVLFTAPVAPAGSAQISYSDTITITGVGWIQEDRTLTASADNVFTTSKVNATVIIVPRTTASQWRIKGAPGDLGAVVRNDQPLLLPISGAAGTTFRLFTSSADQITYIEV